MRLGDPNVPSGSDGARTTLDDLFSRNVARNPFALALADPPNRAAFTDGVPRRLTYAEADAAVSSIAGRLRRLGLAADAIVGVKLANTVESILTVLGVLRAGLIAAPLPLLWRQADMTAALGSLRPRALIAQSRVGTSRPLDAAMRAAAEMFAIRYVCAFGANITDGVIPLDELLDDREPEPPPPVVRDSNPAAHIAVVTFEVTPAGIVAVARNHHELIAGGATVMLETGVAVDAAMLSPCNIGSFAGLASTMLPWLLTGGTLFLHHPFDPAVFAAQCRDGDCDTVIVPGPLAAPFAAAGLIGASVRNVLALWHAPERLSSGASWARGSAASIDARVIDAQVFGETALICTRRGAPGAIPALATARTDAGTLAVQGEMVPRHPFPPGVEHTDRPFLRADAKGFVDTGQPCRLDDATPPLRITAPVAGLVAVGGYRFAADDLAAMAKNADGGSTLAVLPDAITGQRLAGGAQDRTAVRRKLEAGGGNPLIADAFRDRHKPDAA